MEFHRKKEEVEYNWERESAEYKRDRCREQSSSTRDFFLVLGY